MNLPPLKLNWMILRNGETGKILWQSANWDNALVEEKEARVSASILKCSSVSREFNFTSLSVEPFHRFRLEQKIFLHSHLIESWSFYFGFVIPQSTNTWQSVIEAAEEGTLKSQVLSGNVVIHTTFYDGDTPLGESKVRLFYD